MNSLKLLISIILISLISPLVFAEAITVGTPCDYSEYGDRECDAGEYCIYDVCSAYGGSTDFYCTDPDERNEFTPGTVSFLNRDEFGAFVEGSSSDECELDGTQIAECSGVRGCAVREFYCSGSTHTSETYSCVNGCSGGMCIDLTEPDSWFSVGGTVNEGTFAGPFGGASDSESGLQKVELLIKRDADGLYCNGSDWVDSEQWVLATGLDSWTYSSSCDSPEGTYSLSSKATDLQGVEETSFGETQFNVVISEEEAGDGEGEGTEDGGEVDAGDGGADAGTGDEEGDGEVDGEESGDGDSDAGDGAAGDDEPEQLPGVPETVDDLSLLEFIDSWSKGLLADSLEENDLFIQQVIDNWKNS